MKSIHDLKWLCSIMLLFTFGVVVESVAADATTNKLPEVIAKAHAAGDVPGLIAAIPEVEMLWPADPEAYFKCIQEISAALALAMTTNAGAGESLLRVYDAMIEKPCPTNALQATICIGLKAKAVDSCWNSPQVRYDKGRLLAVAKFTGVIRALRIPNYQNRGMAMPRAANRILSKAGVMDPKLLGPEDRLAFDKAMEEGEQVRLMDIFQKDLMVIDSRFTMCIVQSCRFVPASGPTYATFTKELGDAAHFSDEERKQFPVR